MNTLKNQLQFSKSFSKEPNSKKTETLELQETKLKDHQYMRKIIHALPVTANAVLALRFLVEFFEDKGTINPSIETIRRATKLKSKSGVRKMLDKLVGEGFLLVNNNWGMAKGTKKSIRPPRYIQLSNTYKFTRLLEVHFELKGLQEESETLEKKVKRSSKKRRDFFEKASNTKFQELADCDHRHHQLREEILSVEPEIPVLPRFPQKETKEIQESQIKAEEVCVSPDALEAYARELNEKLKAKSQEKTTSTHHKEKLPEIKAESEVEVEKTTSTLKSLDVHFNAPDMTFGGGVSCSDPKREKSKLKDPRPTPLVDFLSERINQPGKPFKWQLAVLGKPLEKRSHIMGLIDYERKMGKDQHQILGMINTEEKFNEFSKRPPAPID